MDLSQCSLTEISGAVDQPILVITTPDIPCLYLERNGHWTVINEITDEVLSLWTQENSAYVFTRRRTSNGLSRVQLFRVMTTQKDGKCLVVISKVLDIPLRLNTAVDYRIFGAYYHHSKNGSDVIKHGFPNASFLMLVGDLNIILTETSIRFQDKVNLHCLWYYPPERTLIGIERNSYHLVAVGFDAERRELFIQQKYQQIPGTGLRHFFYDSNTDLIAIYRKLMASSKFNHELVLLPVSSQLMLNRTKGK